jgi:hypothetical protein
MEKAAPKGQTEGRRARRRVANVSLYAIGVMRTYKVALRLRDFSKNFARGSNAAGQVSTREAK